MKFALSMPGFIHRFVPGLTVHIDFPFIMERHLAILWNVNFCCWVNIHVKHFIFISYCGLSGPTARGRYFSFPASLPSKSWLAWKRWMLFRRVVFIAYAEGDGCIAGGCSSRIQFIPKTYLWVELALWHLHGVQATVSTLRPRYQFQVCLHNGHYWNEQ